MILWDVVLYSYQIMVLTVWVCRWKVFPVHSTQEHDASKSNDILFLLLEICRCRPTGCSSSPPPSTSRGHGEHPPIPAPQVQYRICTVICRHPGVTENIRQFWHLRYSTEYVQLQKPTLIEFNFAEFSLRPNLGTSGIQAKTNKTQRSLLLTKLTYCCIHEQKESSKSIYCIFLLLVAGHKYLQYNMFKYTAVHGTPNRELTLHCSVLIHLEDRQV